MPSALRQHARIALQLARVGIVRKSQLQIEFWCQVVMDCLWYASHVCVFEVLYVHAPEIAGWNREEFRVLLGFLFVSDAFMMIWLSQMWRFGRDLRAGLLDPFRVRPASVLFLYAFQQFSPEGCVNMAVALGYLAYAIWRALGGLSPGTGILALGCIALSFWCRVVVVTLFSLLELWLLGSDALRFVHEIFHSASDRPVDIFTRRVRQFLLYVVPVGALTQLPAALVLGRYDLAGGLTACAWLLGLGCAVFATWNRSFRRYDSAMG